MLVRYATLPSLFIKVREIETLRIILIGIIQERNRKIKIANGTNQATGMEFQDNFQ